VQQSPTIAFSFPHMGIFFPIIVYMGAQFLCILDILGTFINTCTCIIAIYGNLFTVFEQCIILFIMFSLYFRHMPKIYQAFLMSATLGDDVKALKKMVLHNAVCINPLSPQIYKMDLSRCSFLILDITIYHF
jgi:hypothetical protein